MVFKWSANFEGHSVGFSKNVLVKHKDKLEDIYEVLQACIGGHVGVLLLQIFQPKGVFRSLHYLYKNDVCVCNVNVNSLCFR